ncbi:hypothetical protein SETIT_5G052400v2 [Setaria italica]|uniref:Protein PHYTOCHROME KINASE SUBSTRATE 4 n=1 Tax=Setaria italica TaxID=4555 RepID=A0A368R1E6_SETIT|nr:protein PHYTOCHROME KINASE SUBSTRATE 4 [Setaria italica]RCV24031.1 hypothetical protein SETIT_5G052400v2 [Setaria italica]
MDRYRIAPARPVCLSAAGSGPGAHLRAAGRRSGGAEIGIFTAERYFSAADVVRRDAAVILPAAPALPDHELLPRLSVPAAADVASQSGRTAASSEASWNSRSGLLSGAHPHSAAARQHKATGAGAVYGSDNQGYHSGRKTAGGGGSGQRWTLFGRDCPCAGRKAVTVDVASEPRSPAAAAHFNARFSPQSAVDECLESDIFNKAKHPSPPRAAAADHQEPAKAMKVTVTPGSRAFPAAASNVLFAAAPGRSAGDAPFAAFKAEIDRRVVTSGGFTFPALGGAARVVSGGVLDEPPRVSLEVFRPIDEDSVMLADPPPAMPFAGRAGMPPPVVDEDAMSDASSDLFDLESFAASSSYPTTYHGRGSRRNSADDDLPYISAAAEPALSECMYPASEASVVWSVATAEGGAYDAASLANFSSAASACCVDDLRYMVPDPESPEAGFTAAMSRSAGRKKSGGGGFLNSCRCEKAVSVGPTPVRVVRPPAHPAAASRKKGGHGAARHHAGRAHVPVRT